MIKLFRGDYAFLSNFFPVKIKLDGEFWIYPSVEHAFVASKTHSEGLRFEICSCKTPAEAKRFGKCLVLRPDWHDVRVGIMEELVRQKFQDKDLQEKLFQTGTQEIIEGNTWHDNFWGSCICESCGDKGENNLGKLLMKIREEIRQPSLFPIDTASSV